jgi:hypothetical protein
MPIEVCLKMLTSVVDRPFSTNGGISALQCFSVARHREIDRVHFGQNSSLNTFDCCFDRQNQSHYFRGLNGRDPELVAGLRHWRETPNARTLFR